MKNEDMPDTITTPDGQTFWKTGLIGRALPPAATHGIVPGERTHEYWIHPWDDSLRLYAADPMRWFLDRGDRLVGKGGLRTFAAICTDAR